MKQTIYLIRHGHTEGTTKGMLYGRTELKLTEEGKAELRELRDQNTYPSAEGAKVYTSGMIRTEQTLNEIYGEIEHSTAPKLMEINMGIFEMKPVEEIFAVDWGRDWLEGKMPDFVIEDGESQNQFVSRVQNGIREVIAENVDSDYENIIVVCHGGVIAFAMDGLFPGQKKVGWEWTPTPGLGYAVNLEAGVPVGYEPLGAE